MKYGNYEDFKKQLLYKRIIEWNEDKLVLEDGTIITIECSEQDCCAEAYGEFKDVVLDAVITNVSEPIITNIPDDDTTVNQATITIYHNQNPIALAEVTADAGNGGFYYSIGSFVVKNIHYQVVQA